MRKSNFERNMEAIIFVELVVVITVFVFQLFKVVLILIIRLIKFVYKKVIKPLIIKLKIYVKRRLDERQRNKTAKIRNNE